LLKLFEPLVRHAPILIPPSADKLLSWISLEDTVRLILFALDNGEISGPLNVTAPQATTYGQFVKMLAHTEGKKSCGSIPAWLLRMILWENSEAITDSQDVRPAKALAHGFRFEHPNLESWFASHFDKNSVAAQQRAA
jgi:NAD dependent epimerase/dehydratase family enzyme